MHILDLVMYIILLSIIWNVLNWVEELVDGIDGIVRVIIILIYTLVYGTIFWWGPHNWVDIFTSSN